MSYLNQQYPAKQFVNKIVKSCSRLSTDRR